MRRLLVVMGLLLAGCTATEPGTPTVGDRPTETTTTTTTTTTSILITMTTTRILRAASYPTWICASAHWNRC
jgi:hypothetical protein